MTLTLSARPQWEFWALSRSQPDAVRIGDAFVESDDALMRAAAGGDRNAFARLVDRHSSRAFAVAFRLAGNRADAEDLVQEAFIRAWHHASRWEPGRAAFSTWLYRVVVNLGIDGKRRRSGHHPLDQVDEPADDRPGADDEMAARQRSAALAAASALLPDRQRQAIALIYGAGMSNKAASEVIGVSVKGLESLLIRAKRTLRDAIGGQW